MDDFAGSEMVQAMEQDQDVSAKDIPAPEGLSAVHDEAGQPVKEGGEAIGRVSGEAFGKASEGANEEGAVETKPEKAGEVPGKSESASPGKRSGQAEENTSSAIPPAPEDYRIDYGLPGGVDPQIDSRFRNFAHENGISAELAQKLVDFSNQLETVRMEEQHYQVEEWEKQLRAMPGWQGRNYSRNVGIARQALRTFASPELAELIGTSGYGNHPEVVKAFYKVGKRLSEDSYLDSSRRTPRKKTIGEILYPDQPV
ncbi:endoprotease [Maridesulfovibrio sp.]|uniref:endoprotease n=1 Tax=Maridesulfovibrio sp. TaxID=2795000 RepID=UPI002A18C6BC|nr:endoprotease [Maridesulfovibrio sp.]